MVIITGQLFFVNSEEQAKIAEQSKEALAASGIFGDDPIVTKIEKSGVFWDAEDEHQQFYKKHVETYAEEKQARDAYKAEYWGINKK